MSLIVDRFHAAAESYNRHSRLQKKIASEFAKHLEDLFGDFRLSRIFEIGCGTGHLTRELSGRFPGSQILATDACESMIRIARDGSPGEDVRFETWVAEEDHWDDSQSWDLIASSMAFQWLRRPLEMLDTLSQKGNTVAISIPVDGTFDNWIKAHRELGIASGTRPFLTIHELNDWISHQPDSLHVELDVRNYSVWFDHPIEFVRSLKGIGGTVPRDNHRPVNLKRVFSRFPDGIEVSYSIAFLSTSR